RSRARLTIDESFIPRRALATIMRERVSVFLGVPSMYRFFLDSTSSPPSNLRQVRYMLSCTAPLHPDAVQSFHRSFGVAICQHYGSSETGAVTTHVPERILDYPESVGRSMVGVRMSVVDADGKECAPDDPGEVMVRSAAVAAGYIMGEAPGPAVLRDGEFRTGDIGTLNREGFLHLMGRIDSMINVGGLKVSPLEVCRVLEHHAAVREAAVSGTRDVNGEEVVYAMVVLRAPATEQELLTFCHSRLADYKVPRRIDIREELPRGPSGKIQVGHSNP
ncbi:MAG: fatty acid--CoA ligase family protein, partial [Bacteroidota bacterium]